jgi:hypothetical protein
VKRVAPETYEDLLRLFTEVYGEQTVQVALRHGVFMLASAPIKMPPGLRQAIAELFVASFLAGVQYHSTGIDQQELPAFEEGQEIEVKQ